MALTYLPRLPTLGIMAPLLAPWFPLAFGTLPAPAAGALHLRFPMNGNSWFAPAAGTMSVYVTGGAVPPALAALQDPNGLYPFSAAVGAGRILVYFRLLPEVEARLHALTALIPSADGSPVPAPGAGVPTRPQVRSLAMLLPAGTVADAPTLAALFGPLQGDDDNERVASLGLVLAGATAVNGLLPMTHLRRPGGAPGDRDVLVAGPGAGQVDLWAFDRRGRPIDPGAVACWWSYLLNSAVGMDPAVAPTTPPQPYQLMAPGIVTDPADPAVDCQMDITSVVGTSLPLLAVVAPALTVHLTDPHEGPLGAPFLVGAGATSRLRSGPTVFAAGASNVLTVPATGGLAFTFTAPPVPPAPPAPPLPLDNPLVDDAPRPRIALLPAGTYGATVTVWPTGPVAAGLTRDFVRVAVVDEEAFLVGVTRDDSRNPTGTGDPVADARRADQNRPSTRVNVNRTANPNGVLLSNAQLTANSLLALPNNVDTTRLVLGVADSAWGGTVAALPVVPPVVPGSPPPPPPVLPVALTDVGANAPAKPGEYRVSALAGGGTSGVGQTVLLELFLGAAFALSAVRAWPMGFDFAGGAHLPLSGGAALVALSGMAYLSVPLPDGALDPLEPLAIDLLVVQFDPTGVTVLNRRRYAACRFQRPAPSTGTAVSANPVGPWVICETGMQGNGTLAPGTVPAGAHLVQLSTPPALVDRATIAALNWNPLTLANTLATSGAFTIVSLTEPAFSAVPDRADLAGRPQPSGGPAPAGGPVPGGGPGGGLAGPLTVGANSRLHLQGRAIDDVVSSSFPYAMCERLEVAGATWSTPPLPAIGACTAVIGAARPTPWSMEPLRHHCLGYPGMPAAIEVHGTGVALTGAPAIAVAEFVRERTAGLAYPFIQALTGPARAILVQSELCLAAEATVVLPVIPDDPNPGPVVAVLRTGALGMEGALGVASAMAAVYPTSHKIADNFFTWANANLVIPRGLPRPPGVPPTGDFLQLSAVPGDNIESVCRALDRRLLASRSGSREMLTSLRAAIARAQDLVYIETPGIDDLYIGDDPDKVSVWAELVARLQSRPGLYVVLCLPALPAPGTPQAMREVLDHGIMTAMADMRRLAPGRLAVFSPGVGGGRALRLASTSVVIDDAIAYTGTTHLTRRGLSWDSSLSAAVFDQRLSDGRPADVLGFRMQLLADRLGIAPALVPDDPAELVKAIRALDSRGSSRLAATPITRPAQLPSDAHIAAFNPDGSKSDLTLDSAAALLVSMGALTDVYHAIVEG